MLGAQVGVGEYEQRVQQQIKQYATTENMHQLPKSFAYWQRKYFLPAFETIFGVKNHLEFYAKYLGEGMTSSKCWRIASLGCGDGAVEVAIARLLRRNGIDEFVFSLVDLSGPQLDRARRNVEQSGLAENFAFVEADFNVWNATQSYGGVMVHHALHHVQNLEHLTVEIYRCLADEGLFCTIDVIGRNGHQRWTEALDIIEKMWDKQNKVYLIKNPSINNSSLSNLALPVRYVKGTNKIKVTFEIYSLTATYGAKTLSTNNLFQNTSCATP